MANGFFGISVTVSVAVASPADSSSISLALPAVYEPSHMESPGGRLDRRRGPFMGL